MRTQNKNSYSFVSHQISLEQSAENQYGIKENAETERGFSVLVQLTGFESSIGPGPLRSRRRQTLEPIYKLIRKNGVLNYMCQ